MFAGMLVLGTGCAAQPSPGSSPQEHDRAALESSGSAGGPQQVGDDQGQAASDPEEAPADTDTDAPPAAGTYSQYIAFGDSFTTGFGLDGTFTFDDSGQIARLDSNPCAQSDLAWPPLVNTLLNVPNPLIFAACSGAKTLDILGDGPLVQDGYQPGPQIAQLPPPDQLDSALITVQIGGNDLWLDDSFQQCSNGLSSMKSTNLTGSLTSPSQPFPFCANVVSSLNQLSPSCANLDSLLKNLNTAVDNTMGPNLHAAFTALRAAAPNAAIVAVGYPHLVDATSDCSGLWACLPIGYRQQINDLMDAINAKIDSEATDAGIFSITDDIVAAFDGHEMCSPQELIDSSNVHPNAAGHQLYAQVVANGVTAPE
jgi:lysophospholipase L1-like esterase